MADEDNDIIDRNEFFGAPNEPHREEAGDDGSDQGSWEEDASNQASEADEEALPDRVERCFQHLVKPLLVALRPCYADDLLPNYRHEELPINNDVLLVLVHRPEVRNELMAAIETAESRLQQLTLDLEIANAERAFPDDFPPGSRRDCVQELAKALSSCPKLHAVHIFNVATDMEADDMQTRILANLPQIEKVYLADRHEDSDFVPVALLQGIGRLANLQEVHLSSVNVPTLERCLQALQSVSTLKTLLLGEVVAPTEINQIVISETVADLLARLLRLNQLECFTLSFTQMASMSAWRTLCDSLTCSSLTEIVFRDIELDEGREDLYSHLATHLPDMKWLEKLNLFVGFATEDDMGVCQEHKVDENCQLAILRAAKALSRLQDLEVPNCAWTHSLVTALKDVLVNCLSLRKLKIRGLLDQAKQTTLSVLTDAISQCKLELLSCHLSPEESLLAVASGVGENQTIKELTLMSSPNVSFDMMSRICYELRLCPSLKKLHCGRLALTGGQFGTGSLRRLSKASPEAYERLVNALSTNVELEAIRLLPFTYHDEELREVLHIFTYLNKQGRRYIKNLDDPEFRQNAFRFMEGINDSLNCLYVHMHDITTLFRR